MTVGKVLLSIGLLLTHPEPDDPLVPQVAQVYKNDINTYNKNAKDWTNMYAKPQ